MKRLKLNKHNVKYATACAVSFCVCVAYIGMPCPAWVIIINGAMLAYFWPPFEEV